jgi:hypothetical protein
LGSWRLGLRCEEHPAGAGTRRTILNTPIAILVGFGLVFLDQYSFYLMLTIMLIWFGVMGLHMWRWSTSTPGLIFRGPGHPGADDVQAAKPDPWMFAL